VVGLLDGDLEKFAAAPAYTGVKYRMKWRYRGGRHYELSNHLGNVQVVVTDKKIAHSFGGVDWAYYTADVYTASDYGAFGMEIEERGFVRDNKYRYSFNGKETDEETGVQDYGFRMYDARIARFMSVDPLAPKYPELTTYQFASNRPIDGIDQDGLEHATAITYSVDGKGGVLETTTKIQLIRSVTKVLLTGHNDRNDNPLSFSVTFQEMQYTSTTRDFTTGKITDIKAVRVVRFVADMDVDTDGIGPVHPEENYVDKVSGETKTVHQNQTSYKNPTTGDYFNADMDNYIALPAEVVKTFRVEGNALSFTEHGGKTVKSVLGDTSGNKVGEASVAHSVAAGFSSNANRGHDAFDVQYTAKIGPTNMTDAEIQKILPEFKKPLTEQDPDKP
jgi:RHS repeat-associated protein